MTLIELCAKEDWNKEADEYNQWDNLGKDEKDSLIEAMRIVMVTETGEQA